MRKKNNTGRINRDGVLKIDRFMRGHPGIAGMDAKLWLSENTNIVFDEWMHEEGRPGMRNEHIDLMNIWGMLFDHNDELCFAVIKQAVKQHGLEAVKGSIILHCTGMSGHDVLWPIKNAMATDGDLHRFLPYALSTGMNLAVIRQVERRGGPYRRIQGKISMNHVRGIDECKYTEDLAGLFSGGRYFDGIISTYLEKILSGITGKFPVDAKKPMEVIS